MCLFNAKFNKYAVRLINFLFILTIICCSQKKEKKADELLDIIENLNAEDIFIYEYYLNEIKLQLEMKVSPEIKAGNEICKSLIPDKGNSNSLESMQICFNTLNKELSMSEVLNLGNANVCFLLANPLIASRKIILKEPMREMEIWEEQYKNKRIYRFIKKILIEKDTGEKIINVIYADTSIAHWEFMIGSQRGIINIKLYVKDIKSNKTNITREMNLVKIIHKNERNIKENIVK